MNIFNLDTTPEGVITALNKAQNTGRFPHPSFDKEISVVIKDNIMLMGLEVEYGTYNHIHPAREKITKIFEAYESS